jgi:hypothetical protein
MFSFDELGPPWPEHKCDERRPNTPYQWEVKGYAPCDILDGELTGNNPNFYKPVLWVADLKSNICHAFRVCSGDSKWLIAHIEQPFLFKPIDSTFWELNTFIQSFDGFKSSSYTCCEAKSATRPPLGQQSLGLM